jgi:hypothetical protein
MSEVITAVFGAASAASAAVYDLEVAKIPSAKITPDTRANANYPARECAMVTVAVDERHADLVSGILNMYAPVAVQRRAA